MMEKKVFYWSRVPGKFLDKETGEIDETRQFYGTVLDWYNTLGDLILETSGNQSMVIDTSEDVGIILQHTKEFRPSIPGSDVIGMLGMATTVFINKQIPGNLIKLKNNFNENFADIVVKDMRF